jgi:aminopeptidase N
MIDQALETSRLVWRNDPVSFPGFREYVLAHEVAHQWWGGAVGGENYREQWISEGLAQYFAALYTEREMDAGTFEAILRRMQRSAIDASDQGPIWLGYRLGHVRADSRVFRAIVYNKAAMVLHMLRRLIGDAAFFDGLRGFYATFRFSKAGTDDFRLAMEATSGRDLQPFFDAWIFGASIPRLKVSRAVSATNLTVTFDQVGPVLPVPVTVAVVYADGSTQKVVVPVVTARASHTIPLRGTVRDVRIDDDHAALARFDR